MLSNPNLGVAFAFTAVFDLVIGNLLSLISLMSLVSSLWALICFRTTELFIIDSKGSSISLSSVF